MEHASAPGTSRRNVLALGGSAALAGLMVAAGAGSANAATPAHQPSAHPDVTGPFTPPSFELSGFWHLVMWWTWYNNAPVTAQNNPGGVPLPASLVGTQWVGPAGVAWGNDAYLGFGRYGWASGIGRPIDGVWSTNSVNTVTPGMANGVWYQLQHPGSTPSLQTPLTRWAGQWFASVWAPSTGLVIDMNWTGNTEAQGGGLDVYGGVAPNTGSLTGLTFTGQWTGQENGAYEEGRFWMQHLSTQPYLPPA